MKDLLPRLSVSNYFEMLSKLAWFFFVVNCVLLYIFRSTIPEFNSLLLPLEAKLPSVPYFSDLKSANVVIAIVLAILSYSLRLHDKMSDALLIRKDFDLYQIMLPTIVLGGLTISDNTFNKLSPVRKDLMQKIFYDFASSMKANTIVDKHDIVSALTNLSWYWIILETIFQFCVFGLLACFYSHYELATTLFGLTIFLIVIDRYIYRESAKLAIVQIKQIVNDKSSLKEIRDAFNAL